VKPVTVFDHGNVHVIVTENRVSIPALNSRLAWILKCSNNSQNCCHIL